MMQAVMFESANGTPERERFERAITSATLVLKSIYVGHCQWNGNELTFRGPKEDYQMLYFWICGYGDALAAITEETLKSAGLAVPRKAQ